MDYVCIELEQELSQAKQEIEETYIKCICQFTDIRNIGLGDKV